MAIIARVPGINGAIEIDGAASEDTLRALLTAVTRESSNRRRIDTDIAQELKRQAGSARDAEAAMSSMSRAAGVTAASTQSAYAKLQDIYQERAAMIGSAMGDVTSFGRTLIETGYSIATTWTKTFSDIARADPITDTAAMLNRGIGLAVQGVNVLGNTFGSILPRSLQGKSTAIIQGITGLAGSALEDINTMMARELKKTADAMRIFNAEGGSYTRGMTTLRINALEAGLDVQQFASVIKSARNDIIVFGGNLGDGSTKLSRVMESLSTTTGTSGKRLREELYNMGIGFEEQGTIAASYMAQLKQVIGADKLRQISTTELAKGTRQYAEDLKILQEFTGKDAKKVMEKARQDTMRGAILSTLAADQQKSLIDTFSGMEALPDAVRDNLKNALMQQLSGGVITDPVVAQSQEMQAYIKQLAQQVRAGQEGMAPLTVQMTGELAKQVQEQNRLGTALGATADKVILFSGSADSAVSKLAVANNALAAMALDPDAVRRSQQAAREAARGADPMQEAMTQAAITTQDFGVKLGKLITEGMVPYANLLQNTLITTTRTIEHTLDLFVGKISAQDFLAKMTEVFRTVLAQVMGEQRRSERAPGARATGGPVIKDQMYVVGEKGPEVFVPKDSGMIIPNSGDTLAELGSRMQIKELASILNANRALADLTPKPQPKAEEPKIKLETELPNMLSEAFTTAVTGPAGLNAALNEIKKQIADDNKMSQAMLQGQIEKLTQLVNTAQDQIRASENIANALS